MKYRQVLNSLIQSATSAIAVNSSSGYKPVIELRTFFASNSSEFSSQNTNAASLALAIQQSLTGGNGMFELSKLPAPTTFFSSNDIVPKPVDADDITEFRSPSSHAYGMARTASNKQTGSVDNLIWQYIVDCWVYNQKV